MAQVTLTEDDVAEVADVMSRMGDVCAHIEAELQRRSPGRPREWTVYGVLAALLLLARHERRFHIAHAEKLLATLTPSQLDRLQLRRKDAAVPLNTRQLSYAWNVVCRSVDPGMPGFETHEKKRRVELLIQLQNQMLWATVPRYVRRRWKGHLAVDATLVWAHGRPPSAGNDKLYPTGKDGDGLPRYVSEVEAANFDGEPSGHPFLDAVVPTPAAAPQHHSNGRRRRRDRGRKAIGAAWIGNKSALKVCYGYAHHTAVLCGAEEDAAGALPCVAVGQITTPTTANPAATGRLLIEDIAQRTVDGDQTVQLADVLADGGYSGAKPEHWTLPIRALGAQPVFRLHGTNQEGHRNSIRNGRYLEIDGRFYCACLPEHLRSATYPHRPTKDRTLNRNRKRQYRRTIAARNAYELTLRSALRTGLRFNTPHNGGCVACATNAERCCATKTVDIAWADLGRYQRHQFGSEEWEDSYGRRSRVEGYFGNLKNGMVGGHVRETTQFFEYAKVSFAFTFNAMATNLARLASWRAEHAQADPPVKRRGPGRKNHTLAEIAGDDTLLERQRGQRRKMRRTAPPPERAGPDPFAHLGDPAS